ncbi:diacylglycerol kinase family protein [Thermicanus aegyptius]|uniref:diacylglycerol kinase family protein n=1 Tax=Thermicanus aegyptius TaxID=94009 RepID=UPI0009FC4AD2|nr:diacylglycerol kinase family protein [Thermicanus aegyptius]
MDEWKRLSCSFQYAFEGIIRAFREEKNMRIHGWMALLVLLVSLWAGLSWMQILILLFIILSVFILELINTAIEAIVDLTTQDFHPLAKKAKDAGAGAVLLAAFFSVLIAFTLLSQPLLMKVSQFHFILYTNILPTAWGKSAFLLILLFLFFLLYRLRIWKGKKETFLVPIFLGSTLLFILGRLPFFQATGFFLPIVVNIFMRRGKSLFYAWLEWLVIFLSLNLLAFLFIRPIW